jgi:16S rRNA (uracil1498-N3)-methyltransferase
LIFIQQLAIAMSERYFVAPPIQGDRVLLEGPEAHHLLHVMRAKAGDRVVLFDGGGIEFTAVVERGGRDRVELRVLSREMVDRELPFQLSLAVSLPKGERQKWLVEKAVELGVARLVPLITQRSVAQPGQGVLRRLRRTVIEAAKQCGRNRLMQLEEPLSWSDLIARSSAASIRLLAHPYNGDITDYRAMLADHDCRKSSNGEIISNVPIAIIAAVGPEGGFADDEVALAAASGWRTLSLGPRILRVETAAIALAAIIAAQSFSTL